MAVDRAVGAAAGRRAGARACRRRVSRSTCHSAERAAGRSARGAGAADRAGRHRARARRRPGAVAGDRARSAGSTRCRCVSCDGRCAAPTAPAAARVRRSARRGARQRNRRAVRRTGPPAAAGARGAGRRATQRQADGDDPRYTLWQAWHRSGLQRRWLAASERGGPTGAQADRDLDAVTALFDVAEQYVARTAGASLRGLIDHVMALGAARDTA